MSRIGKLPIPLPAGVHFEMHDSTAIIRGPKGELQQQIHPDLALSVVENKLIVSRLYETTRARAMHGLMRTLLNNMVIGVSRGWTKELEVVGTGYRAALQGNNLHLSLGFSHPVIIEPLHGITFSVHGNKITVSGIDKQLVGEMAAIIRRQRKPEPYKGKGIRYSGEVVRRKAGKAKKAGGK